MAKSLCKWRRGEVEANLSALASITTPPRAACSKCARVASEKGYLCRPMPLASDGDKKAQKAKKAKNKADKKDKKGKKANKEKKKGKKRKEK
ncbi:MULTISPECIES: hypothetical protein [unclassified Salinivibrio]|uniref:hypothetical protein n=1 Tax=unclassified Salinivibrio TaxID=2636825 RepID=UPI00128CBA68|nr:MULTISPECIES: hypothetical protein [unclassified Salinivibrio]MPS33592.1 hypothetical protein [Salinivibrio sp. VYel7]MPX92042.1 hypothetical protein [Salinivibrio sp. VYel1]MPX94975.1 hypothetical protein [Salinivibrio sp. VYel9]MPX96636.1 hypothetical protein [Salinivibrio sp. VYel6]MPY00219.1 hypothetical protein [Salinivibrio sp. VYel4]